MRGDDRQTSAPGARTGVGNSCYPMWGEKTHDRAHRRVTAKAKKTSSPRSDSRSRARALEHPIHGQRRRPSPQESAARAQRRASVRLSSLQHEHVHMLGTFPFTLPHSALLASVGSYASQTDRLSVHSCSVALGRLTPSGRPSGSPRLTWPPPKGLHDGAETFRSPCVVRVILKIDRHA